MTQIPVMLDVDTGIDDSLAIALACAAPVLDVVAVSTVAGNTTIDNVTRNTLDILAFVGAEEVPVYRGASRPLARPLATAAHVHGANGLGGAALPRATRIEEETKGPATIVRLAREYRGQLTLICVGPLTNLAIALNVEPELPKLVKSIVIMGGAFEIQGNYSKAAEFNFFVDPDAAAQVFAAPFEDVTLLGLDITHDAPIPPAWWEAANQNRTPAQTLFRLAFQQSFELNPEKPHYMHDAMAVAAAIDRSLISTESRVVTIGGVVDERGSSHAGPVPALVNVAVSVDAQRFAAMMKKLLGID